MLKKLLAVVVALLVLTGGLFAAEGTIVSFEKEKLVVKVGDKERTIELTKDIHVHDADGKEVKVADRAKLLKKDAKIVIEEKNGKVVEVSLKK